MEKRLVKKSFLVLILSLFLIISSFNALAAIADHVVISEVQTGKTGAATDEFVELYNPTNSDINLNGWRLTKKISSGTESNLVTTFPNKNIPAHGFFLITHATGYTGNVNSDVNYSSTSYSIANSDNAVLLYSDAGVTLIDKVGYGAADNETLPTSNPPTDGSIERKSSLTHNELEGNGWDINNNSVDFITRTTPQPQNSSNATEHKANKTVCNDALLCDFTTIQSAIDASSDGDIINVGAGTYTEDLIVDKDITLQSESGKDSTTIQLVDGVGIDIRANANGFTLGGIADKGFTILGGGGTTFNIQLANAPSNVEISYNNINTNGNPTMGISVGAAGSNGLIIKNNIFQGGDDADGYVFAEDSSNIQVSDNIMSFGTQQTSGYAIEVAKAGGDSDITDNTLTNASNCIFILDGAGDTDNLNISNNDLDNCVNAIRFYSGYKTGGTIAPNADDVIIEYNTITNSGKGLRIPTGDDINTNNFKVRYNVFSGNTEAVNNADVELLTAENNWWGAADGPSGEGPGSGDAVSSNVLYYPWYTDSALTTLADATTTHSSTIETKTISNLTQEDYPIQINVTLNNTGSASAPMYDAYIKTDSFQSNFASTSTSPQSCGTIPVGSSCTKTFDVTINGGTTSSTYYINWRFNWTNNDGSKREPIDSSTVTINDNPVITVADNITGTISHGTNSTFNTNISSTGNKELSNAAISYTAVDLLSDWVIFSPSSISSIAAGSNASLNITVVIPKGTAPGNYTGNFTISADSVTSKQILLKVTVPTDDSWYSYPSEIGTFRNTNVAGTIGTVYVNNTGNIAQTYTISYAGSIYDIYYSGLWDTSNPTSIAVSKQTTDSFDVKHKSYWQTGSYDLDVTIEVDSATSITVMNLTLENDNPTIDITNPLNDAFVKGIVDFDVTATDLNLSNIKYYIDDVLVFNDEEINFTYKWDTTAYSEGIYALKAIAYDSAGNSNTSGIITVTVNNTNDAPLVANPLADFSFDEDTVNDSINLSSVFLSIDDETLTYAYSINDTNISVLINQNTGIANLTPEGNWTGSVLIIFNASDSAENYVTDDIIVTINNLNDAPTTPILSSPTDTSTVFSATGKVTLNWTESTDADNDPVTYYVFYGNNTNVTSSATTQNTYLSLSNLNNATTYHWRVYADDETNNSANSSTFQFTVTYDDVPVINSFTPANLTPSVAEGSELVFTINASDPDSGLLNYSWYLDNTLNKTDGNNFTYTPDFTDSGIHVIMANITDNNSNSIANTWTVTVTDTNRAPVLAAITDKNVLEDSTLIFNITASDADGDALNYTSNQSSMSITKINDNLATVSWTPTNEHVGNNTITFTVSDNSLTDSKTITITVTNTNDAPTITSYYPTNLNPRISTDTGSQLFNVTASDVDLDPITTTWFKDNVEAGTDNSYTASSLSSGLYNITAKVNDTSGSSTQQEWLLNVTTNIDSNDYTGTILNYNISEENASDISVNESTYGSIGFLEGVNLSNAANIDDYINIGRDVVSIDTDVLSGLNRSASIIMKNLNYTKAPLIYYNDGFNVITDGSLCNANSTPSCTNITYDTANGILTFNVQHFSTYYSGTNTTNGAPVITSTPETTARAREPYTYDVDAADPDGDILTYSLTLYPSDMSISSSTGKITWTPANSQQGIQNVTVQVSDNNLTDTQSFNISVAESRKLIIKDLDVKVNSKSDKNLADGDTISREAKPEDNIEFKIEIENGFTDEEDLKIEDIFVEITIRNIDDGDDLEEESKEFDLRPEKDKKTTIKFEVPLEVDEDIYDVDIHVEGEDENGTTHEVDWTLYLEVEKEKHDIKIIKAILNPSIVKCEKTITLKTEIINLGRDDEEETALEIISPDLGLNFLREYIELEEGSDDNRYSRSLNILIPDNLETGAYPIEINSYYDAIKLSHTKTVNLEVQECKKVIKKEEEVKAEPTVIVDITKPDIKPKEQVTKITFRESPAYVALLATLFVITTGIFAFAIGAAIILLRRK